MNDKEPIDVLVVDDDPDVREFIGFLLASRGYAVRKAEDGAEALESLAERTPDVLVLDIMMPRLDGRGVLHAMRRDRSMAGVPVIVISGASDVGPELEGCTVLRKPIIPDVLLAEMARQTRR